ncbi:MAG: zinc ABC transporter substrate-binding protein [Rhodocyclaceae bacterium]|nr:zinc ABC transporter substrate-binding protein [Rhodocyclaceae bacterium]
MNTFLFGRRRALHLGAALLGSAGLPLGLAHGSPPLRVVATTQSMGALVEAVGGHTVQFDTLVPPGRDAHNLSARPSMISQLRRADMVVAVGAQLEEGWLPAALDGAANPQLRAGQPGHFAVAQHLHLHDTRFDPSLGGHVHAEGNPHFNLSPALMADAAEALAERMGGIRPAQAEAFRLRARLFALRLRNHLPTWHDRLPAPVQLIAYHEEFDYFASWLPVSVEAFIEPRPGVPPGAGHLATLNTRFAGQQGIIVHADHQPATAPEALGKRLGWPVLSLPLEPQHPTAAAYLALVTRWVEALAHAR